MSRLATTQLTKPEGIIDLSIGQPDATLLPRSVFDASNIDSLSLAYGAPAGDGRFLEALGAWLSTLCGTPIKAESLLVTNGSSNAIDMICTRFAKAGDTVLVEEPTYFIALKQFADHGLNIVPVQMDEQGLEPEALTRAIEQHRPAFVYSIPSFHNPTGIDQPLPRRQLLVAIARQHQCLLVADEVYPLLDYDKEPRAPLASLDAEAPVLSIGTFSKILAPGLRLGWLQGQPNLLNPLVSSGLITSGGGLGPVTSALVRPLLTQGHLSQHLAELRHSLQRRRDSLVEALKRHCGNHLQFKLPHGGYFLWAHTHPDIDTRKLLPKARAAGVGYLPGEACYTHAKVNNALRLSFAFYDERELALAGERLGSVLSS